jgi:hypothetical protein
MSNEQVVHLPPRGPQARTRAPATASGTLARYADDRHLIALETTMGIARPSAAQPIDIRSRRELLVDDHLGDWNGRALRYQPVPREVALAADAPGEATAAAM